MSARQPLLVPALTGLLLLVAAVSLGLGTTAIAPGDLLSGLFGQARGDGSNVIIVQDIRLPRVALGLLVGATLGLAGAALQGLLRNPLAEPAVIGVSSSAALGAVLAIYFGLASLVALALPLAAMVGALLGTGAVFALAGRDRRTTTLVLAGVAINSLTLALTTLAMNLSPNPFALSELVYWLMGSLKDKSTTDVALALPFVVVGAGLILSTARALDALTLGEEAAQSLGVSLHAVRLRIIGGTALAVGAAVAVSGAIGFVGLVVPHLLRPLVGHAPGRLLLPSALGGALLLTLADIVVRLAPLGAELMLGVVTALLGAPFFLALVLREGRKLE